MTATALKHESTNFNLIDAKQDPSTKRMKIKYEAVKLHFLTEKYHKEYMNSSKSKETSNESQHTDETIEMSSSMNKTPESIKHQQETPQIMPPPPIDEPKEDILSN